MKWVATSQIFRTMPFRSYFLFCLAVAFTFAAIGVVNDLFSLTHSDGLHLILTIITTSGFSVLWVIALHRRKRMFVIMLIAIQIIWMIATAHYFPTPHRLLTPPQLQMQVSLHGFLILVFVLFAYGWFGTFFQVEGKRYYAAHTEIELASQIQKQLVPPVDLRRRDVEIYGISRPSGTVGGDLVDVVESDEFICAYVADIAGHGVAAGVMMSMLKTAVRMQIQTKIAAPGLLEAVNETLAPLTAPSAYATFASVIIGENERVSFIVAAHPPILHYQSTASRIERHTVDNLPVALFPGTTYQSSSLELKSQDILAIVSDGLTEVFNSSQKELGESYIEETLTRLAREPLSAIGDAIFGKARSFGKIADDQTILLIRRAPNF